MGLEVPFRLCGRGPPRRGWKRSRGSAAARSSRALAWSGLPGLKSWQFRPSAIARDAIEIQRLSAIVYTKRDEIQDAEREFAIAVRLDPTNALAASAPA